MAGFARPLTLKLIFPLSWLKQIKLQLPLPLSIYLLANDHKALTPWPTIGLPIQFERTHPAPATFPPFARLDVLLQYPLVHIAAR